MKIRAAAFFAALLGALLLTVTAFAHAGYLRSEPGSEAVVAESPSRVDIWFTEELFRRQGENKITVIGPGEQPVQVGEAQIDDDDRTHLWVVLQPALPPGEYRVEWRSLSAEDGDTEEGSFLFTLDPQASVTSTPMGAPVPTNPPDATQQPPAASRTPASSPAAPQSTAAETGSQPGGGSCLGGLLPAAGLAGAAWIPRRRRSARG